VGKVGLVRRAWLYEDGEIEECAGDAGDDAGSGGGVRRKERADRRKE
jgi:hypothetical protein